MNKISSRLYRLLKRLLKDGTFSKPTNWDDLSEEASNKGVYFQVDHEKGEPLFYHIEYPRQMGFSTSDTSRDNAIRLVAEYETAQRARVEGATE